MNDIGIHLYETFFSKSWKKRTFWDFEWRIGVRFFLTNIEKTHPKSSPKISLNIPNFSCPSQKNAPFFLIILRKNKGHWKRLIIISLIYCMKIGCLFVSKLVQKKGAFFWNGHDKFGIFRPILGDESRCVFPIFF